MSVSWGPANLPNHRPYELHSPRIFFNLRRDAQAFIITLCDPSGQLSRRHRVRMFGKHRSLSTLQLTHGLL